MFNPTAANLTTLLLVAITIWVIYARFRMKLDTSWPLFYYLAVVAYSKTFPDLFSPIMVYIGVVCGLLLRFEFMGGFILQAVRAVELVVLAYFVWNCLGFVFWW
jgi:hypothetical protein